MRRMLDIDPNIRALVVELSEECLTRYEKYRPEIQGPFPRSSRHPFVHFLDFISCHLLFLCCSLDAQVNSWML